MVLTMRWQMTALERAGKLTPNLFALVSLKEIEDAAH